MTSERGHTTDDGAPATAPQGPREAFLAWVADTIEAFARQPALQFLDPALIPYAGSAVFALYGIVLHRYAPEWAEQVEAAADTFLRSQGVQSNADKAAMIVARFPITRTAADERADLGAERRQ